MWPEPVTLADEHVRLEPLSQTHCLDLQTAASDGDLHNLWYTTVPTAADISAEIDRRCGLQQAGTMLPFAICLPDGTAVGMTTYMNIDAANKRVEIGSTWLRRTAQRSPINTEAKRLLLAHAFGILGCIAVEFRTHVMNQQSRRAIERLGAKQDGILRSHMRLENGTIRDSAIYSIIASEWPAVRANLDWILESRR